ncbi:MAG: tripartite tricarboxylate transporter permease [Candidatus Heteroscillospira sp.]|jgi:putative tricarboxylic transport membrane protein
MIAEVIQNLLSLDVLLALLVGVGGGMIIGALPGLGATMGIAILIPVTYTMNPIPALIMLTSIYTSAIYGGSITAILLHTPGTPASAATAMDGYALTLKGQGLRAIGMSTVGSMIGGTLSGIMLLIIAPPLARFSLQFNAPEYFLLAIFGLSIIGSLAADNLLKGIISGVFGLCLALVGYDIMYGTPRFDYGITALQSGIQTVPALIGLFSMSQVMIQAESIGKSSSILSDTAELKGQFLPTFKEMKTLVPNFIRSGLIGVIVGILPGAGGDIGSWMGYNEAKRFSKHKEEFGNGSIEGICASETANNAVTGGALIPLITLGIPGSSAAAVLLGGLMIHGLTPGAALFTNQGATTYSIITGFIIANIAMGVIGMLAAKYIVNVVKVPYSVLAPIIIVLSVVGAYAINISFVDTCIMLVFGFLGYYMRKFDFPTAPVVLGLILGSMAEQGLLRSMVMAKDTPLIVYYLSRPICIVLLIMIVAAIFAPVIGNMLSKKIEKKDLAETGADVNSDD